MSIKQSYIRNNEEFPLPNARGEWKGHKRIVGKFPFDGSSISARLFIDLWIFRENHCSSVSVQVELNEKRSITCASKYTFLTLVKSNLRFFFRKIEVVKTRVNDWIRYKLNRIGNRMAMNGVLSLVIHFLICPSWQSHRRQTKAQFQFDCDIQIKREKHHLKSNIHSSPSHTMYQLCNPFQIKFCFSRF